MATISKAVVAVLILFEQYCVNFAEWNTRDYMKKEHSLVKPYVGTPWDFVGSTMLTNNYIRLTSDHQSMKGGLWNQHPVLVRDWELHIQFKVHGKGTNLFGDGFAIWYTKERLTMGDVFGSKNFFHGLAIFMDTYSNHNGPHNHLHPYISAMVDNGTMGYDHDADGTHTELAGCEALFRNLAYDTYVAVRYSDDTLTVSTDINNKGGWKECFTVKGVHLPTGYYLGFSAATGQLADNHDIISAKFYELETERKDDGVDYSKIEPSAQFFASPRDHVDDAKGAFMLNSLSGWKLLVVIILIIIGIGVCLMVGFIIFQKSQENSRKRFY
ncbi:vesicular integral-membrane protein VIP36 isoform X1 [Lingula anatina]|uniref:Vesicular integral-membrane protein VIP36 isoform X1 n=2 Tax=Lingula anatina TaxID=7574 RepID=A0A1S3H4T5_LINAN|nr:vesicular integral-membrane protein VIP36 isoform X1 [Lingula anatina]|eukprot:XP_013381018.1 vesicular integral-membrane protein VIP36 isoform X1 [Lingula anatina]